MDDKEETREGEGRWTCSNPSNMIVSNEKQSESRAHLWLGHTFLLCLSTALSALLSAFLSLFLFSVSLCLSLQKKALECQ
jgi:hypothetical protein